MCFPHLPRRWQQPPELCSESVSFFGGELFQPILWDQNCEGLSTLTRLLLFGQKLIDSEHFEGIKKRAVFVHVVLPGQEDKAEDLKISPYPTMQVRLHLEFGDGESSAAA